MTDRKKPGVAFWASVVVVALAIYLFSVGPAFLMCSDPRGRIRGDWTGMAYLLIYDPIIWTLQKGPKAASAIVGWYLGLWGMP